MRSPLQRSQIRLHQRHRSLQPLNPRMSSLLRCNQLQPSRPRSQLPRKRPHLYQVFLINQQSSSCLIRRRLRSLNRPRLKLLRPRHQLLRHQSTLRPQPRRQPPRPPRTPWKQLRPLRVQIRPRLHRRLNPRRPLRLQRVRPRQNRQRPHQLQRSAPRTYGAVGSGPFPVLTLRLVLNSSAAMLSIA
jgi:hypothetical protein